MTMGKIYTLTEVAEYLRLSNRMVAKIARRHGLCMAAGRKLIFTGDDVEGIKQAMRIAAQNTGLAIPRSIKPGRNISSDGSSELLKLVLQRSRRPSLKKLLKAEFGED
jgi:hypothetical protein